MKIILDRKNKLIDFTAEELKDHIALTLEDVIEIIEDLKGKEISKKIKEELIND